jgi:hypothetical protein
MDLNSLYKFFLALQLNDLNHYLLHFDEENPKKLDQDEIIKILDKKFLVKESVSHFIHLENLQMIRCTNCSGLATLQVDEKKRVSVTISVGMSTMNSKSSNMCSHFCEESNHDMSDCSAIAMFKKQRKACFEARDGPGKKSLAFIFKEINAQKAIET